MKLSPVFYFKHKNIDLSAQVYLLLMYKPAVFCDNLNNLNLSLFEARLGLGFVKK